MAANVKNRNVEKSPLKGFVGFFKDLGAETHRITWPSKETLKKTTIAVITFCAVYIIVVAIMDFGFNNLFKVIFK
ncbi:preprotein translocase subunit SecE [Clostridium felsineum]|uniref:Protein translocase subunit SecE n=1 Tax=Clostridium felsineum TaxID=36839 RepID=A0A1S8KYF4_9CLOT|nr:preprotein translocase subunit SecE [Clostridium felsineum]MCR3758031.1 preprotein translocase subunit SecE [Clostridium felsineum]URZ03456.1 Protein translocase subunit SecE [Clostridium felsineum]URZ08228.1 Protein translocase subunit SecE [Clostridium felsineum]URZ13259.1 Protein translocase subunit SecE [Clostridium felsineum]URZ14760.1 Protein translocase subunit SecE [Clostridium felsineum DSM 794]